MPGMGIAIVLLIGYVVTVAKHGATDVTAYKKGKEAPSIEKFRTRHREKAEGKLKAPRKSGGKEPGPVGKWARALADNAAAELAEKQRIKSEARRKWYQQTAPQREKQWQEKWQRKLDKREQALERWKRKRGLPTDADPAAEQEQRTTDQSATDTTSATSPDAGTTADTGEQQSQNTDGGQSTPEQPRPDNGGEQQSQPAPDQQPEQEKGSDEPPTNAQPDTTEQAPKPDASTPFARSSGQSTPASTSGGSMYDQVAEKMQQRAEAIDQYRSELAVLGDGLFNKGWGAEVTGPLSDMSGTLGEAAAEYRDLAISIRQQGDNVAGAYDQAPYAPDRAALGV